MTGTTYGEGPNPALSEGEVFSTLDDYGRFVQLILDRGVRNGRRVLSEHAIQEMRRAWSNGVPVVSSPRGTIPYGLGAWLDEVDETGTGIVLSSPGIGGFVPLVDYRRELVFVFAAQDDIARIGPGISAILQQVRAVVDQGAP